MSESSNNLRVVMPQWQGGDNHLYYLGSQLLAWLAPVTDGPIVEVDVPFSEEMTLDNENGIVGRSQIIPQQTRAKDIILKHKPESIVMLGGDCLVSLTPFAYLLEKYGDKLGILWIDAHPDIMTSEEFEHSHASVLRVLMGEGDKDLTQFVTKTVSTKKIMYAGLNDENEYEADFIKSRDIKVTRPAEIQSGITSIQKWVTEEGIKYLAVHFDLDVLSRGDFYSLYFNNPFVPQEDHEGIGQGQLTMDEVLKVFEVATDCSEVVGLTIAEHLPWDAMRLKKMMEKLPLLGKK